MPVLDPCEGGLVGGALIAGSGATAKVVEWQSTPPSRFESNVVAYEAADFATPAPRGAILLVGDSQFFRWRTLAEDLPGHANAVTVRRPTGAR